MRALARNESTLASNNTLIRDISDDEGYEMNTATVTKYLNLLNRMMVLEDQQPFGIGLRSSVRGGASMEGYKADLDTFRFIFESLCSHDLRIYAEANGGKLFHYHDSTGMEVDSVVELPDGRWGAFEVRLGEGQADAAAESLLRFRDRMRASSTKARAVPEFLCVVTGVSEYAYRRDDGVYVVPITALGP